MKNTDRTSSISAKDNLIKNGNKIKWTEDIYRCNVCFELKTLSLCVCVCSVFILPKRWWSWILNKLRFFY